MSFDYSGPDATYSCIGSRRDLVPYRFLGSRRVQPAYWVPTRPVSVSLSCSGPDATCSRMLAWVPTRPAPVSGPDATCSRIASLVRPAPVLGPYATRYRFVGFLGSRRDLLHYRVPTRPAPVSFLGLRLGLLPHSRVKILLLICVGEDHGVYQRYATTMRRAQGATLYQGCVYFDGKMPAGRGYGYVAVSRFQACLLSVRFAE